MLKVLAAAAIMIAGAVALIFAAMKFYEKISDSSSGDKASGIETVGSLRKIYTASADNHNLWKVVYISIYKSRLKSIAEYSKVLAAEDLVQKSIDSAVNNGLCEAAAVLDGKNYVLLTKSKDADIKNFCENFMADAGRASKNSSGRYASLFNIHIGVYGQVSTDIAFDDAVDSARRAAKHALETHAKFCFSSHDVQTAMRETELIEKDIDSLIDNNEFYMVIQPFIGRDGSIIGGELLSRFRPLDGRDISLHKYLRAIQKEDLFGKFDFAVFEKCLSWQESRGFEKTGIISCNFTRFTVSLPGFTEKFRSITSKYNVNPSSIGIEITEDNGNINRERLIENICEIKKMGFLIFIDDFGSGNASIDDLYSIPIDVLKLDKSLLRHTDTENGKIIFEGICGIAKKLGFKVLCEGVENETHVAFSDKAGCDIRQGFYYYRPMLVSEYEELYDGKSNQQPEPVDGNRF